MSSADDIPRLELERIIRPALELLEAMGAEGECYEHHERAFRELTTIEEVIRGARRVADYAGRMITRDGLAAHVRRDNGIAHPSHDVLASGIARQIRNRRRRLLEVLEVNRRIDWLGSLRS